MRLLNALYAISKVLDGIFGTWKSWIKTKAFIESVSLSLLCSYQTKLSIVVIFFVHWKIPKITMKYFVLCALFAVALAGQHHGGGGGQPQELVVHVSGGGGGASHAGAQSHAAAGPARKWNKISQKKKTKLFLAIALKLNLLSSSSAVKSLNNVSISCWKGQNMPWHRSLLSCNFYNWFYNLNN